MDPNSCLESCVFQSEKPSEKAGCVPVAIILVEMHWLPRGINRFAKAAVERRLAAGETSAVLRPRVAP